MEQQFVYGIYDSISEAQAVYEKILKAGIPKSGLQLIANDEIVENTQNTVVEPVEELMVDKAGEDSARPHTSWLESFTTFFVADGQHNNNLSEQKNRVDLSGYQAEVDQGKVLLLVNQSYEGDVMRLDR